MNSKKFKGFTLLELIIVIAIIAIMAMVLVPAIGDNVKFSKQRAANDQAHEIYIAAQDYLVNLQLRGTKPASDGIVYITMYNTGAWHAVFGTAGTSTLSATEKQDFADALAKGVCGRMGGDFNGVSQSNSACTIAFYAKTFTIKHVVFCDFNNGYEANKDSCAAIGGDGTSAHAENLYVKMLGMSGHTQEYDYKTNGNGTQKYVGQYPIN